MFYASSTRKICFLYLFLQLLLPHFLDGSAAQNLVKLLSISMFQLSLSLTLSLSLSFSLTLSLTLSLSLSPFISFSLSLTLPHSLTLSLCLHISLSFSLSLSLPPSLTYLLTYLLTLTINEYLILHLLDYQSTIPNFSIIISNLHRGRFDPTAYQQRKDDREIRYRQTVVGDGE